MLLNLSSSPSNPLVFSEGIPTSTYDQLTMMTTTIEVTEVLRPCILFICGYAGNDGSKGLGSEQEGYVRSCMGIKLRRIASWPTVESKHCLQQG